MLKRANVNDLETGTAGISAGSNNDLQTIGTHRGWGSPGFLLKPARMPAPRLCALLQQEPPVLAKNPPQGD